jgi:hypothetical protein
MTGYDVLRRVQMPRVKQSAEGLRVPLSLCEDGSVFWRTTTRFPTR